uniref:Starch binding domain-containing protein n=1 Tax=Neospora caninum (strain Liverpool) TaxID=572307 RepID=A0A0F7UNE2_NEOCL|nr:TPA: starch binding domain-containing protein [Neospora caninum Liverpool]
MTGQHEDTLFCYVRFNCHCNQTHIGDQVCLLGSTASLGNWSFSHRLTLTTSPELFPLWRTECPVLLPANSEVRYKFLICREDAPLCLACRYGGSPGRRGSFGARKLASLRRSLGLRRPLPPPSSFSPASPSFAGHRDGEFFPGRRDTESASESLSGLDSDSESRVDRDDPLLSPPIRSRADVEGRAGAIWRGRRAQGANGRCGEWRADACPQREALGLALTVDAVRSQACCGAVMKGEWEAPKRWESIRGVQGDRVLRVATHALEVFDTFGAEPAAPSSTRQASAALPSAPAPAQAAPPLAGSPRLAGSREDCWYISPGSCLFACDSAEAVERRSSQSREAASLAREQARSGVLPCLSHREGSLSRSAAASGFNRTSLRRHVPPLKLPADLSHSPLSGASPHYGPTPSSSRSHSYFSRLKRVEGAEVRHGDSPRLSGWLTSALPEVYGGRRRSSVSTSDVPPFSARLASLHAQVPSGATPRKVPLSPLASDSFRSALQSMAAYYPAHGLADLAPTALGSTPRGCAGGPSETANGATATGPPKRAEAAQARGLLNAEREGEARFSLGIGEAQGRRTPAREGRERERESDWREGRRASLGAASTPRPHDFAGERDRTERGEPANHRYSTICAPARYERAAGAVPLSGKENAGGEGEAEAGRTDIDQSDPEQHCLRKLESSPGSAAFLLRLFRERSLSFPSILALALASASLSSCVSASPGSPLASPFLESAEGTEASSLLFAMRHLLASEGPKERRTAAGATTPSRLLASCVSAPPREGAALADAPQVEGRESAVIKGEQRAREGDTDDSRGTGEGASFLLSKTTHAIQDAALVVTEAAFARLEQRLVQTVQAVCTPRVSGLTEGREAEATSPRGTNGASDGKEGREESSETPGASSCRSRERAEKPATPASFVSGAQSSPERKREGKDDEREQERGALGIRGRGRTDALGRTTERRRVSFARRKGMPARSLKSLRASVRKQGVSLLSTIDGSEHGATDLHRQAGEGWALLGTNQRGEEANEREGENDGDGAREEETGETSCLSTHVSLSSFSSAPHPGADQPPQRTPSGDARSVRASSALSLPLPSPDSESTRKENVDEQEETDGQRVGEKVEGKVDKKVEEKEEGREKASEEHLHAQLSSLNDQVTCLSSSLFEIRREQAFSRQLLASLCGCLERALEERQETGTVLSGFPSRRGHTPRVPKRRGSDLVSFQLETSETQREVNSEGEPAATRNGRAEVPGGTTCVVPRRRLGEANEHDKAKGEAERAGEGEDGGGEKVGERQGDSGVAGAECEERGEGKREGGREDLEFSEGSVVPVYALDVLSSRCESEEEQGLDDTPGGEERPRRLGV